MKEFLTESEAAVSRTVTRKLENMPKELKNYANYLDKNEKAFTTINSYVTTLKAYYEYLSTTLDKNTTEIKPEDIEKADKTAHEQFLKSPKCSKGKIAPPTEKEIKQRLSHLEAYYQYLVNQSLINEMPLEAPKRPKKLPTISSPDKVRYTQIERLHGARTAYITVDRKYIIEKHKTETGEYYYLIFNNQTDSYFSDKTGNFLQMKRKDEARAFVKSLY